MEIYPLRSKRTKISYSPKDINTLKSLMLFMLTNPQRIFAKTNLTYSRINHKKIFVEQLYAYSYDFHISYKDLLLPSRLTLHIPFSEFYDNIIYNSVEDYIKLILVSCTYSYKDKDWRIKFMKPIVYNGIFPLIRKKKNMIFVVKLGSIKRFAVVRREEDSDF